MITIDRQSMRIGDSQRLTDSPPPAWATHVVLWPRPDGGYLIAQYARSGAGADAMRRRADRHIANPCCPRHVIARFARET